MTVEGLGVQSGTLARGGGAADVTARQSPTQEEVTEAWLAGSPQATQAHLFPLVFPGCCCFWWPC